MLGTTAFRPDYIIPSQPCASLRTRPRVDWICNPISPGSRGIYLRRSPPSTGRAGSTSLSCLHAVVGGHDRVLAPVLFRLRRAAFECRTAQYPHHGAYRRLTDPEQLHAAHRSASWKSEPAVEILRCVVAPKGGGVRSSSLELVQVLVSVGCGIPRPLAVCRRHDLNSARCDCCYGRVLIPLSARTACHRSLAVRDGSGYTCAAIPPSAKRTETRLAELRLHS